jgi:hypothetical protein
MKTLSSSPVPPKTNKQKNPPNKKKSFKKGLPDYTQKFAYDYILKGYRYAVTSHSEKLSKSKNALCYIQSCKTPANYNCKEITFIVATIESS